MKTKERSYMFIGLAFTSQAFFLFLVVLSPRRSTISNEKRKTKMGEAIVLYRGRGSSVDPELLKPTTITSNGTYTAPVTGTYRVSCVGGGGGGGGGCRNSWNSSQVFYGAGGSRGSLNTMNVTLNAGDKVQVNLGSGGAGGTNNTTVVSNNSCGTNGGSGGTTTFGSYVSGAGGSYGAWSWSRHVWTNTYTWNNRITGTEEVWTSDTIVWRYSNRIAISFFGAWSKPNHYHSGSWQKTICENNYCVNTGTWINFNWYGNAEAIYSGMIGSAYVNGVYTVFRNRYFRYVDSNSGISANQLASLGATQYPSPGYTFINDISIPVNSIYIDKIYRHPYTSSAGEYAYPTETASKWTNTKVWNNQVSNTTTRCYTSIQQGSWWYTSANNVTTSGTRSYRGDGGASGQAGNAGFILVIPPQSA